MSTIKATPYFTELLDLANAYCDTKLKKHCNEFIKKGLTLSNVIAIYIAAIQGNIKVTMVHN